MAHAIQAFLFDMDGLLLDTEGVYIQVYADLSRRMGCPQPPEVFKQFIGKSAHVTCSHILSLLGGKGTLEELMAQESALYFEFLEKHRPAPLPGVREMFEYTERHGLKRGLVSSTISGKVEPAMKVMAEHLGHFGRWRDCFHAVCTGETVRNLKPAPDLYLAAAQQLGLAPAECVAFEDSVVGVGAAHAAGCRVVAVPNLHLEGVDVVQGRTPLVFKTLLDAYRHIEQIMN